jgi:hypothetical protein
MRGGGEERKNGGVDSIPVACEDEMCDTKRNECPRLLIHVFCKCIDEMTGTYIPYGSKYVCPQRTVLTMPTLLIHPNSHTIFPNSKTNAIPLYPCIPMPKHLPCQALNANSPPLVAVPRLPLLHHYSRSPRRDRASPRRDPNPSNRPHPRRHPRHQTLHLHLAPHSCAMT